MRIVALVVQFGGAIHPYIMGIKGRDEGEFVVHLVLDISPSFTIYLMGCINVLIGHGSLLVD